MAWPSLNNLRRLIILIPFVLVATLLGACMGSGDSELATQDVPAAASAPPAGAVQASAVATGSQIVAIEPLQPGQAAPPVRLQIPQINLDIPVEPMGWAVVMIDDQRTTLWQTPTGAAGWHVNSAGAGGIGRTVLSGRQTGEQAVFAQIALGSVMPGQEILLTDADGLTFVYRVSEVTAPIPIAGATAAEEAKAAAYLQPVDTAQLVLISGWPEFTTTHRIFVVADFAGTLK